METVETILLIVAMKFFNNSIIKNIKKPQMIETKTQKNISNIIISGVLEKRQTCTQPAQVFGPADIKFGIQAIASPSKFHNR